ncbi:homoserine dehydrogenase [Brucepastera parasyntrophica]|uniref:homoserine dehydrogenase n=1 Tax=Brucepastera parasyntrophica TaxID=2880008 RepID=UPI002109A53D|nr:homoserine dehydrogenase [Brucepastera parasyntrophica]
MELKKIVDLDITNDRGISVDKTILSTDIRDILDDKEINTVVEVIGGENPAKAFIEKALLSGKNVVTSNKEVIAKHGKYFTRIAKEHDCSILYEAAVGGGIPVLHAIQNSLSGNNIEKIFGIVNGTTNYILSKMAASGADFSGTLQEAQELGYAEADPKNDIEGYDVAYKLAILASLAFRCDIDYSRIFREGITKISSEDIAAARQFGYTIKMLAMGINHKDSIELHVHPVMIENSHPLATVNDVFNAIYIRGDNLGDSMFYGRGAGELPTASAVVGDIMNLAFRKENGFTMDNEYDLEKRSILPMDECITSFFIRYSVEDKPGVLADIAAVFAKHTISILSIQQIGSHKDTAAITAITHPVTERQMKLALEELEKLDSVREICSVIRVGLGE